MTGHAPVVLGQLNDGAEPQYPGTDIPRLCPIVQGVLGCELPRLDVVLPDHDLADWATYQGDPADEDNAGIGIALRPGWLTVTGVFWVRLGTWAAPGRGVGVLIVRGDYDGAPMSLCSTKRPAPGHAVNWPTYDPNLAAALHAEARDGRIVWCGIDANQCPPTPLLKLLPGFTWSPARPGSVVGFLTHRVNMLAVTPMETTGEHPPVIGLGRVPLLNA